MANEYSITNIRLETKSCQRRSVRYDTETMRDLAIVFLHLITTALRLLRPGGARSIVAESLLIKQQLLINNRSRQRGPNVGTMDRIIAGLCSLMIRPSRVFRSTIILKPSTILGLHRSLVKRKYRLLFSPIHRAKPGPKGPSQELIAAIVAMKHHNPDWGCPRIAAQISLAFGVTLDKDVVRRILARHYRSISGGNGPSWLTFLGQMKDSLWSINRFRCESATLESHWVLLVMDKSSGALLDSRFTRVSSMALRCIGCLNRRLAVTAEVSSPTPLSSSRFPATSVCPLFFNHVA